MSLAGRRVRENARERKRQNKRSWKEKKVGEEKGWATCRVNNKIQNTAEESRPHCYDKK